MTYLPQPLACNPTLLDGLSAKLITSHHDNNYGGTVKRLNAIRAELATLDWTQAPGFKVGALKREELIAANSAFLHELYFDCLGASPLKPGGLSVAFARDFGSFEAWHAQFVSIGKSLRGGSGWALCSWSMREHRLLNHWSADHAHLMAGTLPILALDMYEHSYHMDYGANAEGYVDAFMRNIDWDKANARYSHAIAQVTQHLSVPGAELLADQDRFHVIDVRRAGAYQSATDCLPGATWRDPEQVAQWSGALPPGKPVLVYCVYGHEVSQSTAAILRGMGIDARFLAGGIHDWKSAGLRLQAKEAGRV
jgi:superoxide dismutase, Fe-Mn family